MSIPFQKPHYGLREIFEVGKVFARGVLARGKAVEQFEGVIARVTGRQYAIAVANATCALHLLVKYVANRGKYVITTPYSFVSSANVGLYESKEIVFTDIDTQTLLMDPKSLRDVLEKYKGDVCCIIYVDIFGSLPASDEIKQIAKEYDVFLIEDASQAIGSQNGDIHATALGDAAVISFHENKQFTTGGEGGVIVTDNKDVYEYCKSVRDQGRVVSEKWRDEMNLGYNFRMTELQAAFGVAQLQRFSKVIAARTKLARLYMSALGGQSGISFLRGNDGVHSWFTFPIFCKDGATKDKIALFLSAQNIGCGKTYFPPIHSLRPHANSVMHGDTVFCEDLYVRTICPPFFYGLSKRRVRTIASIIKKALETSNDSSIEFYNGVSHNYHTIAAARDAYLKGVDALIAEAVRATDAFDWLDIGSADGKRTGRLASHMRSLTSVSAMDNAPEMISLLHAKSIFKAVLPHDISFTRPREKYGLVTILYNVLGHIATDELRESAVRNAFKAVQPTGVFIFDVNNRYNIAAYGYLAVLRNMLRDLCGIGSGDFPLTKTSDAATVFRTQVHIFTVREIKRLLRSAGITNYRIRYVDYATGCEVRSSLRGQIVVEAKAL